MTHKKIALQLVFDENLKRDANLPTTERLAFDDLGDFIEERERIKRLLERRNETALKVDYSDFANHVFFDEAQQKLAIGTERILNKYPFNGSSEEKDAFELTGSGYENYLLEQWPREVAYVHLNGTDQFITASDSSTKLHLGSSSLHVSAWIQPEISDQNMILQYVSGSTAPILKQGYELYLSGATDPHLKFSLYSGSEVVSVSASYSSFVDSFNNVAAIFDKNADILSLYINEDRQASSSVGFGPVNIGLTALYVGSGSQFTAPSSSFDFYSGSLNEVRVLHTASELFHRKNFSRPITAENYVKLHYKFNEGITETGSIDNFIVDYSQSGLHGRFLNFATGGRVSGSVMLTDPGDPILYSFHSKVVDFTGSAALSATLYDLNNNNNIFNMIPEGVLLEDDNANGLLRSFSLAMARFFDDIKLSMDQFVNLRVTNYDGIDETPDLFLPHLKRYFGWKISEHFDEGNPLEFLFGESILESGSLETSLSEIRNQFWRRILNNLPLLMKSKGTRKNVDYFFNTLGLNTDNIKIKEYGYLPGTSIQDERIPKEKVQSRLGIGTGSVGSESGSFVKISSDQFSDDGGFGTSPFTVEVMVQLPFASASYSGSIFSGSLWHTRGSTGDFRCYWIRPSLLGGTGKIVFEASSSAAPTVLSSSDLEIFDGDFVHIAAGRDSSDLPFISVRGIEGCDITLSEDFSGSSTVFSGDGGTPDFVIGANTSSLFFQEDPPMATQGFFGEARFWDKQLSGSELDDHALNFQSIGVRSPFDDDGNSLRGHWALNEDLTADTAGIMSGVVDLSRNGRSGVGLSFIPSRNPYDKFLHEFNYLSPSIDLKWTENKIRIRNKTELKFDEVASDTNEVSLEFNFIDSLNEDIVKIFSTLDTFNDLIGQPIFKYRDEYSDLEGVRRDYFERLGDQLNFTQFFNLFKWFDKKISDSVKQLLPTRVKFIGGEQVVESHLLERPKYKYHYPIFRTPQDPPEVEIDALGFMSQSQKMTTLEGSVRSTLKGDPNEYFKKAFTEDLFEREFFGFFLYNPALDSTFERLYDVASDGEDTLVVVGTDKLISGSNPSTGLFDNKWMTLRSDNGGRTWNIWDLMLISGSTYDSQATCVDIDVSGNVYVAGQDEVNDSISLRRNNLSSSDFITGYPNITTNENKDRVVEGITVDRDANDRGWVHLAYFIRGLEGGVDAVNDISVSDDGYVYVAAQGQFDFFGTGLLREAIVVSGSNYGDTIGFGAITSSAEPFLTSTVAISTTLTVLADPLTGSHVFAGGFHRDSKITTNRTRGFFHESTDAGATWEPVDVNVFYSGAFSYQTYAHDAAIDSSGAIYVLWGVADFDINSTSDLIIRKSHLTSATNWDSVLFASGARQDNSGPFSTPINAGLTWDPIAISIDKNDKIYASFAYSTATFSATVPFGSLADSLFIDLVLTSSDRGFTWTNYQPTYQGLASGTEENVFFATKVPIQSGGLFQDFAGAQAPDITDRAMTTQNVLDEDGNSKFAESFVFVGASGSANDPNSVWGSGTALDPIPRIIADIPDESIIDISGECVCTPTSLYEYGDDRVDRNVESFKFIERDFIFDRDRGGNGGVNPVIHFLDIDLSGNIYFGGELLERKCIFKGHLTGGFSEFGRPPLNNITGMAIDEHNNIVYVCGRSGSVGVNSGSHESFTVARTTDNGANWSIVTQGWPKAIDPTVSGNFIVSESFGRATSIDIFNTGSVVVVGHTGTTANRDFRLGLGVMLTSSDGSSGSFLDVGINTFAPYTDVYVTKKSYAFTGSDFVYNDAVHHRNKIFAATPRPPNNSSLIKVFSASEEGVFHSQDFSIGVASTSASFSKFSEDNFGGVWCTWTSGSVASTGSDFYGIVVKMVSQFNSEVLGTDFRVAQSLSGAFLTTVSNIISSSQFGGALTALGISSDNTFNDFGTVWVGGSGTFKTVPGNADGIEQGLQPWSLTRLEKELPNNVWHTPFIESPRRPVDAGTFFDAFSVTAKNTEITHILPINEKDVYVAGLIRDSVADNQRAFVAHVKERDRIPFFRTKVSGDSETVVNNPNTGINFRNEFARKLQQNKDRDNE